ncbi:MAG: MOSC domain-containing protein [Rhodobacteraceae bacterium]|nr:MOSC domain-containing protein [Paracoccaceae bacterium]
MTARVTGLWRHPIKSHGREALNRVTLTEGATLPGDRVWAVAHEASKADNSAWSPCANFSIGAKAPGLMGINAELNADGTVTLTHPDLGTLTLDPDREGDRLIDWTRPIMPRDRAASARVLRVPGRGMTDTDYPSVSLGNMASHRAVEEKLGQELSEKRWRLNIWLDGLEAWEEFGWIGAEVEIGTARLALREPVRRCMATTANPDTGLRDADTLAALNSFGHQDLGLYAEVTRSGEIALGDGARLV